VLGFTATPDDFKLAGAESKILGLLKFKKFNYILGGVKEIPELTFDEVSSYSTVAEKASLIGKYASCGPVLVYCNEALITALKEGGCDLLAVTEDIDTELLRSLDKANAGCVYKVLVAEDPSAMRGYDYRSPNCAMTLVIDRSFDNFREAVQGYYRVGRFGDQCKRIRFGDATLVDQRTSIR
jgi:hypothetical protein